MTSPNTGWQVLLTELNLLIHLTLLIMALSQELLEHQIKEKNTGTASLPPEFLPLPSTKVKPTKVSPSRNKLKYNHIKHINII